MEGEEITAMRTAAASAVAAKVIQSDGSGGKGERLLRARMVFLLL